jgi:hypothetical protein
VNPDDLRDLSLFEGLDRSGMDYEQVWLAQVGLGGTTGPVEIEAYILGLLRPDAYRHNLIAQAINEHFLDGGGNHPVAYIDP